MTVHLWDGVEWGRRSDTLKDGWTLLGNTVTPAELFQPGTLTVRILSVGNELLAEGDITVTED